MKREEHTIKSIKTNNIEILPLMCPTCGATLDLDDNIVLCSHCNFKGLIKNRKIIYNNNTTQIKEEKKETISLDQLDNGNREVHDIVAVDSSKRNKISDRLAITLVGLGITAIGGLALFGGAKIESYIGYNEPLLLLKALLMFGGAGVGYLGLTWMGHTIFDLDDEFDKEGMYKK